MPDNKPQLSWGHININVSDLDQSVSFYRKLGFDIFIPGIPYLGLGMNEGTRSVDPAMANALQIPADTQGRACIMRLHDGFPMLDLTELSTQSRRAPLQTRDRGLVRLCLSSSNLEQDVAMLTQNGITFEHNIQADKNGLADIAICRDPDGTLIELIQVYLDKWQAVLGSA